MREKEPVRPPGRDAIKRYGFYINKRFRDALRNKAKCLRRTRRSREARNEEEAEKDAC